MRIRDIENVLRYGRVVRNPWRAASARKRGAGELVPLRLRGGGELVIRSRTSDIRVFKDVYLKDVYRLRRLEKLTLSRGALDCVVDIGGHIGIFSSRASRLARRVIACEPMQENAAVFRRNMEAFPCPNVQLVEQGVSSSGDDSTFFTSENSAGHSVFEGLSGSGGPSGRVGSSRVVSMTTLAKVFEDFEIERCNFLKVDCEGGEYDILFGAGADLLSRIDRIAMEYHNLGEAYPQNTGEELERHLTANGFVVDRRASARHTNYGLLFAHREGVAW